MNLKINSPFVDRESIDLENFNTDVSSPDLLSFEPDLKEDLYPYNEESATIAFDSFNTEDYADLSSHNDENENHEHNPLRDTYSLSETASEVLEQFQVATQTNTLAPILSVALNLKATKANKKSLGSSGIATADIYAALSRSVDVGLVVRALTAENQKDSNKVKYLMEGEGATDSVFTEVVHQFQALNYLNPGERDGVAGRSVLETLGFFHHKLKGSLNTTSLYGQVQLNQIKDQVARDTMKEFTAATWFNNLVKPSWLGVKIGDGIHILLLRKLKEAEAWLLAQPKYAGMSPVALGTALGLKGSSRYSGARLSKVGEGMHSVGLALDIDVSGNPWIGAGWIKHDPEKKLERIKFLETLRKASGERLPGSTIFSYLDSLATSSGSDTAKVFQILKEKNDQFIKYLQKKENADELKYWTNSETFKHQSPLKGFLNLHPDLVFALRHIAGLAWGAIDFGYKASGDIMHFDMRTVGVGKSIAAQIHAHVPFTGHPTLDKESFTDDLSEAEEWQNDYELEQQEDGDHHEAVEELTWSED
jgi:hypothetical protein